MSVTGRAFWVVISIPQVNGKVGRKNTKSRFDCKNHKSIINFPIIIDLV